MLTFQVMQRAMLSYSIFIDPYCLEPCKNVLIPQVLLLMRRFAALNFISSVCFIPVPHKYQCSVCYIVHFAEKKKTWRDGTFEDNWYFLKASGLWTRICIDFLITRKMMRRWCPREACQGCIDSVYKVLLWVRLNLI